MKEYMGTIQLHSTVDKDKKTGGYYPPAFITDYNATFNRILLKSGDGFIDYSPDA
ncbi:hypothetical protein LPW36_00315 [Jinshanibacter sp. LJY008]|uniref:Uncharacterized protein n=1 Tax=Limnobaculum eriocheiris TaxID=2897391 RepID=A0A9X1SJG2_9GAMM|nr:hypothetical protein [Limnobaculum eriocheiris]MCD1124490.1 hypothetical protein [Limnobaculum eriocheiris]